MILVIIISLLLLYILSWYDNTEYFTKTKKHIIGEAKTVKLSNLSQIFPNIVPLRDQIKFWPANVPLTPFKAPFLQLPTDEPLPSFLLYDPYILSPVRNQGDCGACWAFALCDTLSDRLCILTGTAFNHNLSVQQLLECYEPNGCDGGSPEEAGLWLSKQQFKLTTESRQPFKNSNGGYVSGMCIKNKNGISVGIAKVYSIVHFIEESSYDENILNENILNMKRELFEGGPIYCALAVYDDLFSYDGIRPYTRSKGSTLIGGHAIEIIGYCEKGVDKRKGFEDGYWFCRNSWGKGWPIQTTLDGFFMVKMGVNMCGIESRCGFAEPVLFGNIGKHKKNLTRMRYTTITDYIDI